jgi:hypothetical protein
VLVLFGIAPSLAIEPVGTSTIVLLERLSGR